MQSMRLASRAIDSWELRSGEEFHRLYPDTFWIPEPEVRANLERGQAVRLFFDIEGVDEQGEVVVTGERMWVIVAEKIGDTYLGILDNEPVSAAPDGDQYLCYGAEVPFRAEHVIDVIEAPADYVEWQLGQEPEKSWPRDPTLH